MATGNVDSVLNEASPSVQAHIAILQGVIQRMGANSSSCKSWCITIVSAILLLVADKSKPDIAYIALIPTILFLALDAYYLALEKGFRAAYSDFVRRLHSGALNAEDLYEVRAKGKRSRQQIEALRSFSIWGFYVAIIVLIIITRVVILGVSK